MSKTFSLIFVSIAFCLFACNQSVKKITPPPYRLIAYASDMISHQSAEMLTHVNFSFANIRDGQVVVESKDSLRLAHMHRIKAFNPDIKILISVGGWGWSDGFSDAALTDSSRHRFARSAIRLMKKNQLDGIDIDWEYPAQPGDNNPHRPADTQNYTLLLQTLRQYLDAQSLADKVAQKYLLTVATGANQRFLDLTEMDIAVQYLDFVNVMTYDFYGAWSPKTGHHTNLSPADSLAAIQRSAKQAIQEHHAAGIPKDKLVLGAAFYGKGWRGVANHNYGLHQSHSNQGVSASYKSLVQDFMPLRGTQKHWDSIAQAPFLWNPDSLIFYTYEDTLSLRLKAEYVREEELGGMMFWHIRHDTADVLLRSIYDSW